MPTVVGFTKDSVALECDRVAPGDRICTVNGISTARLTNDEVLRLLDNVEERASLEVEYYMPNYASQNSLYITTKLAEVPVEKVNGSLGITIRGGLPENSAQTADLVLNSRSLDAQPLLVTHVRPGGAAYNTSRIKPGDRLLKVDHVSLTNKTLSEVHAILQNCPQVTSLTIEYDVSIMESVKLATGPLLVEIERPCNEDLGLFLSNQRLTDNCYSTDTYQRVGDCNAIYIDSILPASISDRCGALHPGDQLLSFDSHVADGYTAEEVMCYLENSEPGFTRLHVAPRHLLAHNTIYADTSYGASTLNGRKQRIRNMNRESSVPKMSGDDYNYDPTARRGRSVGVSVVLEVMPGECAGVTLRAADDTFRVHRVLADEPAARTGCIRSRDRLLSINGHEDLSLEVANEILQRRNDGDVAKYLTLGIEFEIPEMDAPAGIYNVRLPKTSAGLGITITGCKREWCGARSPVVISSVRGGSSAHRCGALRPGDLLLAVNGTPLHSLSLDSALTLLQHCADDAVTLKVRRADQTESHVANASVTTAEVHAGDDSGHHSESPVDSDTIHVQLTRPRDKAPLGLTIAGSEDVTQPILVSGLVEGGVAEMCGKLMVGDELLSINGESVLNKPLSEAIKLLQQCGQSVALQLSRKYTGGADTDSGSGAGSAVSYCASPSAGPAMATGDVIEYAIPDKCRDSKQTDEDKLRATYSELPLPNYSLNNSLKTFSYESHAADTREEDVRRIDILTNDMKECHLQWQPGYTGIYTVTGHKPTTLAGHYDNAGVQSAQSIQQVILYKDAIYDDYGFSVSDGLYERGVYINTIRRGGPADIVGLLRPYDRILQVNGTRTADYDCCLTVPLIAAASERLELVVQRQASTDRHAQGGEPCSSDGGYIVTI